MNTTEKLLDTLYDFYNDVLAPNGMQATVVGSLALALHGLPVRPHDIDLEVIATDLPKAEALFGALAKANKCTLHSYLIGTGPENRLKRVTWTHKPFIFKYNEVTVNVWLVNEFSHPNSHLMIIPVGWRALSIAVAPVASVLEVKAAYQRVKDVRGLLHFAHTLIKLADIALPT